MADSAQFFLIHASKDKTRCRGIAGALRERGVNVFYDEDSTGPSDWTRALPLALGNARGAIIYITSTWHRGETGRTVAEPHYARSEVARAIKQHRETDGRFRLFVLWDSDLTAIAPTWLGPYGLEQFNRIWVDPLDPASLGATTELIAKAIEEDAATPPERSPLDISMTSYLDALLADLAPTQLAGLNVNELFSLDRLQYAKVGRDDSSEKSTMRHPLFKLSRRVIVTASTGWGKTLAAREVCRSIAKDTHQADAAESALLPILLDATQSRLSLDHILDTVPVYLRRSGTLPEGHLLPAWQAAAATGGLVIIVDRFTEAPPDAQRRLLADLSELLEACPLIFIALLMRKGPSNDVAPPDSAAAKLLARFWVVQIRPLTPQRCIGFLRRELKPGERGGRVWRPQDWSRLRALLSRCPELLGRRGVGLIAAAIRRGVKPKVEADVFDGAIRHLAHTLGLGDMSAQVMCNLGYVALALYSGQKAHWQRSDLFQLLFDLRNEVHAPVMRAVFDATSRGRLADELDDILTRLGTIESTDDDWLDRLLALDGARTVPLFVSDHGNDYLHFTHAGLQEALIAGLLARPDFGGPDAVFRFLAWSRDDKKHGPDRWTGILRKVAGLCQSPGAFIERLSGSLQTPLDPRLICEAPLRTVRSLRLMLKNSTRDGEHLLDVMRWAPEKTVRAATADAIQWLQAHRPPPHIWSFVLFAATEAGATIDLDDFFERMRRPRQLLPIDQLVLISGSAKPVPLGSEPEDIPKFFPNGDPQVPLPDLQIRERARVVRLPDNFRLAAYMTTIEQFRAFEPGYRSPHIEQRLPATGVDWWMAYLYAAWRGGRLPTSAEFEYAARGDRRSRTPFPGGNTRLHAERHAHFDAKALVRVGTKDPNAFKLYDMLGNAWEWVHDRWSVDYTDGEIKPRGPAYPQGRRDRTARGGHYGEPLGWIRAAALSRLAPAASLPWLAFRVARDA